LRSCNFLFEQFVEIATRNQNETSRLTGMGDATLG